MRITKTALLTSLSAFVLGSAAFAADLPVKAPSVPMAPPAPVINWTGCYINAGWGYGMFDQNHHLNEGGVVFTPDTDTGGKGWLGVVGGGCDMQWNNFVVGALVDYDFMDIKGNFNEALLPGWVGGEKEKSAWGAGARVGYLITPAILTYINGGWSSTKFGNINTTFSSAPGVVFSFPGQTYDGWFLGGGTEVILTGGLLGIQLPPGLFWRNEYRYASYGCHDLQLYANGIADTGVFEHSCKHVQTITSSLVWKFNWGGGKGPPVSARY